MSNMTVQLSSFSLNFKSLFLKTENGIYVA